MFSFVLTIIGAIIAQVNPLVVQYTVNKIQELLDQGKRITDGTNIILMISLLLLGKEILNIFVQFGQKFIGEKLKVQISATLSNIITDHILNLAPSFFTNQENSAGALVKNIDFGIEGLSKAIKNIFIDILPLFTTSIFALIIMYRANLYVGISSSIVVPIYFYLSYKQAKMQRGVRHKIVEYKSNRTNLLFNILSSILVIKSYVQENYESDRNKSINASLASKEITHHKINHLFDSIKIFFKQIGIILVIIITAYLVLNQNMPIGAIMLHIMLFNNITLPIEHLHRIYDENNEALDFSKRFFDILDCNEKLNQTYSNKTNKIKGNFSISNVSFSYNKDNNVIKNVSFDIKQGLTTALVGLSGAGKTTIVNLLTRFYDVNDGIITLDGIDIKEYDLKYLRNKIGIVLQQNHIFDGTIEENIRYGKIDATHDEIVEASRKAYLHQIVKNRYKTNVHQLSGGEKQRVAIARLFLKNPPIVLLDEPTASLDAIATEQIKNALDEIRKERTVLIISHNISQIIDADFTYVLKEGELIESGTHETLYSIGGHYKDIIDSNAKSLNFEKLAKTLTGNLKGV